MIREDRAHARSRTTEGDELLSETLRAGVPLFLCSPITCPGGDRCWTLYAAKGHYMSQGEFGGHLAILKPKGS